MSEFDPRWPGDGQDDSGRPGRGEPGQQGPSGSQPHQGYAGYNGQPGSEYRSGSGLGDPSREPGGWAGYTYPGGYGNQGDYQHTAQFGQSGWSQQAGQWGQQYPPYYPQQRRRPVRSAGFALGAIALSVLIGLAIGRLAWPSASTNDGALSNGSSQNAASGAPPAASCGGSGSATSSINASAIAAKVDPGLVDINTVIGYQSEEAAGTGIVLTSNGEILTNNHVVEGATGTIKVTDIGNGQTYAATVVGFDRTQDVAVLQLQNASGLTTEKIADSSRVAVGDAVVGIGNAGGAGGTPSAAAGAVTALNQSITASDESSGASEQLTGLIQTNADIQSGDSGGSLVNSSGEVIGMDTAASSGYQFSGGQGQSGQGQSPQGGAQSGQAGQCQPGNQGFAIPINQALGIAHQILDGTGSATVHIGQTAFLGVSVNAQPGGGQGQGNGLGQQGGGFGNGSGTASAGAQIESTIPNGPAEQAGLQEGDVITGVDGQTVNSATALTNVMDSHHPGDKLTISYTDVTGQQHSANVIPVSGPVG